MNIINFKLFKLNLKFHNFWQFVFNFDFVNFGSITETKYKHFHFRMGFGSGYPNFGYKKLKLNLKIV